MYMTSPISGGKSIMNQLSSALEVIKYRFIKTLDHYYKVIKSGVENPLNSDVENHINDMTNKVIRSISVEEVKTFNIQDKKEMANIRKIVNKSIKESTSKLVRQIAKENKNRNGIFEFSIV